MRFLVLALLPLAAFAAQCTISGDPHYTSFDKVYHDFQGQGVFQIFKSDRLNVQSLHIHCNPAAPFFTSCIRSVTMAFTDTQNLNLPTDLITYGIWGAADAIRVNGQVVNIAGGNYKTPTGVWLRYKGNSNVLIASYTQTWTDVDGIQHSGLSYSVTVGEAYMMMDVPFDEQFLGSNGLCGRFDGTADNEFTDLNGNVVQSANAGVRYNGAHINAWAQTFSVVRGGAITPLASSYHVWQSTGPKLQGGVAKSSHRLVLQDDPPAPVIPTASQQAELEKVPFQDLNTMEKLQLQCAQAAKGDQNAYQNCMYDGALFGNTNFNWAMSNGLASQAAREAAGDQESKSIITKEEGTIIGAVLGSVAGVSILVALFLYYRLKKTQHEYSTALIRRTDAQASQGAGGPRAQALNVADNI